MSQFIDYLIKLSGTLMVLYLFYWLVLRRLTFYTSNRWYLMGYSVAAFFIPLINISPLLKKTRLENDFVQWVPVLNAPAFDRSTPAQANDFFWQTKNLVLILFAAGVVLMLIRFCIQYFSVRAVRKTSRLISAGEVKVYHSDKNIIPFSFGNSIFINKDKHTEDDLRDIIRHEFIHVKQKHTVDILISEWLCILNWYNPFAWLIRKAIRQNLEFIADRKVLENGIDRKQYQYLLLKVVGVNQYGIATSFNFTSLKKRIAMMNKMRSAKLHLVKFLFVLPMLVVILLAFRNKDDRQPFKHETIAGTFILPHQGSNDILIHDTIPSPKKATTSPRPARIVEPNDKGYIITIADNHGECIVIVRDKQNKIVKAMSLVEWDENEKQYTDLYGKIPPPPPSVEPPVPPVAPEAPQLPENVASLHAKDKKLTIVSKDGQTEVFDLNKPEQKAAFEKKYNINLRTSPQNPKPTTNSVNDPNPHVIIDAKDDHNDKALSENEIKADSLAVMAYTKRNTTNRDNPGADLLKLPADFDGFILVDDKEYSKKAFEKDVKLSPSDVKSVDVFKGEAARQAYGEKGKNGVIRIVTK